MMMMMMMIEDKRAQIVHTFHGFQKNLTGVLFFFIRKLTTINGFLTQDKSYYHVMLKAKVLGH